MIYLLKSKVKEFEKDYKVVCACFFRRISYACENTTTAINIQHYTHTFLGKAAIKIKGKNPVYEISIFNICLNTNLCSL